MDCRFCFPLLAVLGLLLPACGGADSEASSSTAKAAGMPPIILVSLDTCRADRLGFMGARNPNSPALDKLASESVVFTNCISQSSNTGPSHRSLFTGMYPTRHKHAMGSYVQSPFMMSSLLKDVGYKTVAFTGGGFLAGKLGFADGFDIYVDKDEGYEESMQYRRGLTSILPQAAAWWRNESSKWSGSATGDPFLLFLHTYDIHCPYWPGEGYRNRYGGWYKGAADLQNMCGQEDFQAFLSSGAEKEDINYLNAMYDAGVAMTDELTGRFLAMLKKDGVLDKSILVITSDHGETLGEHRYIGHNQMWEEQLHVPLMIRFPGGKWGGTRIGDPVMLVDVLPTLLDALELPAPEGVQGTSLMDLARGTASFGDKRFRMAMHLDQMSFRLDNQWKVIVRQMEDGQAKAKLYDLSRDPRESRNLLNDPQEAKIYREVLDDLLAEWKSWREDNRQLDEKLAPSQIEGAIDKQLQAELSELGYTGFEEE
ncbi:MAG TPA: sulfatase [Planctomycetota bacterium]|nr:sulfatase [Planctomycetota bacterium]MDP7246476.1 sulfatase [Planctomycetota bacterium]HJM40060.1 sulfatase [Planctomycetota bacterium]